jgi:hypothetical protein
MLCLPKRFGKQENFAAVHRSDHNSKQSPHSTRGDAEHSTKV